MKILETPLNGAYVIKPSPVSDDRGWFARVFCASTFRDAGLEPQFTQVNHARTEAAGTIRGLHYQVPPRAETKLVRCVRGEVLDVIVDVRRGSPTFLQWHAERLSDENRKFLYVPQGFAHGYQTLTEGTEVMYQSSAEYAPDCERQVRFDDPSVGIEWAHESRIVSPKDAATKLLADGFEGIDVQ